MILLHWASLVRIMYLITVFQGVIKSWEPWKSKHFIWLKSDRSVFNNNFSNMSESSTTKILLWFCSDVHCAPWFHHQPLTGHENEFHTNDNCRWWHVQLSSVRLNRLQAWRWNAGQRVRTGLCSSVFSSSIQWYWIPSLVPQTEAVSTGF